MSGKIMIIKVPAGKVDETAKEVQKAAARADKTSVIVPAKGGKGKA